MIDLLEADKIARVVFQNFCHQRLPVFPGMGTVLGQAEPEIKRHNGDRGIGIVFVLLGVGYGGYFCHQAIACDIPFRLSIPGCIQDKVNAYKFILAQSFKGTKDYKVE
jgi:hypothetical protein